MNELVTIEPSASLAEPESIGSAVEQVRELVRARDADLLDDVRLRCEAQSLYESRRQNRKRERYFATLRLVAEAGLGCLSFEEPSVIKAPGARGNYKVLAAALERGRILDLCGKQEDLKTTLVVHAIRREGLCWVPARALGMSSKTSLPWARARRLAMERGTPLESLPGDSAKAAEFARRGHTQSLKMMRLYAAQERLQRMRRRSRVQQDATTRSPQLGKAYGLLRQSLQQLHEAQTGMSPHERQHLDAIVHAIYGVEDQIGALLKLVAIDKYGMPLE